MSERLPSGARLLAHSICWNAGMCTASVRDPLPQHGVLCASVGTAIEGDRETQRRETLRYLAAYLLDRGDQQDTDGGKWVPLADAAHAIAAGEFEAAWKHGEIDEGDVLERVDRWFARREPSTETAAATGTTRREKEPTRCWFQGQGKRLVVVAFEATEPELMFRDADIVGSLASMLDALAAEACPSWCFGADRNGNHAPGCPRAPAGTGGRR